MPKTDQRLSRLYVQVVGRLCPTELKGVRSSQCDDAQPSPKDLTNALNYRYDVATFDVEGIFGYDLS